MSFVLIFTLLIADSDVLPELAQKELKQLQGEWVMQSGEKNGMKFEFKEIDSQMLLEIKDDKWIFTGQDKGKIISLDPKTNPKCMDVKSVEKGREGKVDEAIYKLEGDRLTICLHQGDGKRRPTEFKSEDSDTILAVFKRVKR